MKTTYEKIDELLLQHGLSTKEMKSPSLNMAEAWSIVEYLNNQAEQYTYTEDHYLFQGPTFKPSTHYLEEYTLGTTCWYIYVDWLSSMDLYSVACDVCLSCCPLCGA